MKKICNIWQKKSNETKRYHETYIKNGRKSKNVTKTSKKNV